MLNSLNTFSGLTSNESYSWDVIGQESEQEEDLLPADEETRSQTQFKKQQILKTFKAAQMLVKKVCGNSSSLT